MDSEDIVEQLFQAIDAIVAERIRALEFDRTVIATIVDNTEANYGRYKVTTDDNITFQAFTDNIFLSNGDKVYVRVPGNDYTRQKIITSKYIPERLATDVSQEDKKKQLRKLLQELRVKGE